MPVMPVRPPMRPMTPEGLATTQIPTTAYQLQGNRRFGPPSPAFSPAAPIREVDPSAYPRDGKDNG